MPGPAARTLSLKTNGIRSWGGSLKDPARYIYLPSTTPVQPLYNKAYDKILAYDLDKPFSSFPPWSCPCTDDERLCEMPLAVGAAWRLTSMLAR